MIDRLLQENPVPRVAAIHDMAGFGRTSLTVVIPVLSAMGIQCCPLPTALLSTATSGYPNFTFMDLTAEMERMLTHWESVGARFDAVYSGFLGSPEQVELVARCIKNCSKDNALAIIDPVLGDDGAMEPTMDKRMVDSMRKLIAHADIITPNFTEACLLLDEPYREAIDNATLMQWLRRLTGLGAKIAIITSVPIAGNNKRSAVVAYNSLQQRFWKVECDYIPAYYPGTGDTFTSVITGALLQGDSLPIAMDRAVSLATGGIRASFSYNSPSREGMLLERVLPTVNTAILRNSYELLEEEASERPRVAFANSAEK